MTKLYKLIVITLVVLTVLALPLTASASTPGMGWYKDNYGRWSYNTTSGWYKGGWQKIDSNWYLFDSSAYMLTGWQKQGGTWYYLKNSGDMATGWENISGTWYYFASSGAMQTGWQKAGGKWYFMTKAGNMLSNIWIGQDGHYEYYVGPDGAWIPGWATPPGKREGFYDISTGIGFMPA